MISCVLIKESHMIIDAYDRAAWISTVHEST